MTVETQTVPDQLLRDLSEDEFQAGYACDRFTATVLSNRFRYTVRHMCTGLLHNAFSLILRDWYDFAATISGPRSEDYPLVAVSNSLVLFSGTMGDAVRNVVEEYGHDRLRPGDVLLCNDPVRAGNHVNDLMYIRPIFHDGEIVGFVNLRAHMLDMGGIVPAGFSGTKRNIYENGLVIGPMLLYRDDEPVRETWSLIFDNARFGTNMLPDMKTIYQNLLLGERLLRESIDRYGLTAYLGAMRYTCDASAETMRQALERLPDGDYEGEDFIDCDGIDDSEEYKVHVKVVKRGGRAEVDLSGSSRQARTSINAGFLDAKTGVGLAFKYLLDPHSAFTSATCRDIDIVVPPGTIVSALPPDGPIFLYFDTEEVLVNALLRALQDALGGDAVAGNYGCLNIHNANGVHPDGTPWVTMAQCGGEHGPWGATKAGDGDSYNVYFTCNNLDPATEAIEADVPVVLMRKEYAPDTGGPGVHRGGAGVLKDSLWLSDCEHHSMPLHLKYPSGMGVHGGADGRRGATWVFDPGEEGAAAKTIGTEGDVYAEAEPIAGVLDPATHAISDEGEYFYFARVPVWKTRPGTTFRYLTNGGGGWGDPLERDPERVKEDVRDEYVSIAAAERDYGVVVVGDPDRDPEGLSVDHAATSKLREERRKQPA
ncbi:MAG TPA: hydantoinase B/oxoprolinase family protein [Thermoleophilaceae bacterium]|nr:hydantoinase B/oxoprolinase family protein [Thermoleophilaceae bacterium]